jgi:hypothetical protein
VDNNRCDDSSTYVRLTIFWDPAGASKPLLLHMNTPLEGAGDCAPSSYEASLPSLPATARGLSAYAMTDCVAAALACYAIAVPMMPNDGFGTGILRTQVRHEQNTIVH